MADSKITALTAISTVDPTADPLVIVDVSDTSMAASGTTKKATINQILGASGTATLASATITGALGAAGLNVTGSTIPANGVYLGSANNLSFSAASALGMTLNATGLGVGVSPLNNLHVKGASGATAIRLEAITDGLLGFIGSASGLITGSPANNIALRAENGLYLSGGGNATQFILNSAGNVGIGVTPSGTIYSVSETRLVVKGTSNSFAGTLAVQSKGTTNAVTGFLTAGDNTNEVAVGSTTNSPLNFYTNGALKATIDTSGNLLVGTTSTSGSASNASNLVLGGAKTANGSVSATAAVATTIFSITATQTGRYEVVALIGYSGGPSQYTAIATIIWDGNGSRVVANNGSNLTITISGSNVQITQTSGSTQTVSWSFLRIAL